jgi:DNA-binding transcriptional LysR family regulator
LRSIPTDLLRAFVAVIDLRGFTRAGEQLGRTQPAISLQMKRLRDLVGVQLFAEDGGGARLTEEGEIVATYARQILTLNDEMLLRLQGRDLRGKLRLGIPNDYADHFLPRLIAGLPRDLTGLSFDVVCDVSHELLKGLRDGRFDIVVAMTPDGPAEGAFMTWRERLVWVGSKAEPAEPSPEAEALRIVCYPEGCLYRRNMLTALQRDGRVFDIVYSSPSISGIEAAVASGFGLTVLAERIVPDELRRLPPPRGLPRLADVVVGIYIGAKTRSTVVQSFAARLADMFVEGSRPAAG